MLGSAPPGSGGKPRKMARKFGSEAVIAGKIARERARVAQSDKTRRLRSKKRLAAHLAATQSLAPGPGAYRPELADSVVFPARGKEVQLGVRRGSPALATEGQLDSPDPAMYRPQTADGQRFVSSPRFSQSKTTREAISRVYLGPASPSVDPGTPGPGHYRWEESEQARDRAIPISLAGSLVKSAMHAANNDQEQEHTPGLAKARSTAEPALGPGQYQIELSEAGVLPATKGGAMSKASRDDYERLYLGRAFEAASTKVQTGPISSDTNPVQSTFSHPMYKSVSCKILERVGTVKVQRPDFSRSPPPVRKPKANPYAFLRAQTPDSQSRDEDGGYGRQMLASLDHAVAPRSPGFSFSRGSGEKSTTPKHQSPGPIYTIPGTIGNPIGRHVHRGPTLSRSRRMPLVPQLGCVHQPTGSKGKARLANDVPERLGKVNANGVADDAVGVGVSPDLFASLDPNDELVTDQF